MSLRLITSESVTEGHPDKIADQISDGILDEILRQDPLGRVACETLVTTGLAMVSGEITTGARLDLPGVVRDTIKKIGYTDADYGIDGDTCAVITTLDQQAAEIAVGVDGGGAGDQGMMFGYASDETDELMPAPILLAHRITGRLAEGRRSGDLSWARPDGKAQVTMEYEGDRPVRIHTVVVAAQHHPDATTAQVQEDVIQKVLVPVLPAEWFDPDNCVFHINPAGTFVTGGPHGDTGLTGRKIIVDTYGGMGHHGGGCFSGKDATKVDRSGAYAARWAAKNVIAAGAARRCEIQIAYAIGVAEPVSIHVDTFGTGVVPNGAIADAVSKLFDFTPGGIIERLHLRDPIFLPTAAYGHFGRTSVGVPRSDAGGEEITLFPWEVTDRMEEIKEALGL